MKKEIRQAMSSKLIPAVWGLVSFLLLQVCSFVWKSLSEESQKRITDEPLWILIAMLALLIVILLALLILLLKEKKLIAKDGVYWDDKNNPFCPSCKIPVTIVSYDESCDRTTFFCVNCKNGKMNGDHT
jgi:quinol-cytochrome oxidoreductase complex cytochrome b subunit